MNNRINKKIHTKFLSDAGVEVSQDKEWEARLSQLGVGDVATIESGDLPSSFYDLNPLASKYKLKYEVKRVELHAVPTSESGWWQIDEQTAYLVFYPSEYKRSCWYVAINFQS